MVLSRYIYIYIIYTMTCDQLVPIIYNGMYRGIKPYTSAAYDALREATLTDAIQEPTTNVTSRMQYLAPPTPRGCQNNV